MVTKAVLNPNYETGTDTNYPKEIKRYKTDSCNRALLC